ncbi:MAG: DNRLRE domain-containing protein, partial [Thermoplasmata archaeon]|nr:DNRLRE domain-containing protein [Thermoplasmata archaeon]
GEDAVYIFLSGFDSVFTAEDAESAEGGGYLVKNDFYAENMIEIKGQDGEITSSKYYTFNGNSPFNWSWKPAGKAVAASGRKELEASVELSGEFRAYFHLVSWDGEDEDWSDEAIDSSYPGKSIEILNKQSYPELGGKWEIFFKTTGSGTLLIKGHSFPDEVDFHSIYFLRDGKYEQIPQDKITIDGDVISLWWHYDEGKAIFIPRTAGKHTLEFEFGNTDYAYNLVATIQPSSADSYMYKWLSGANYGTDGYIYISPWSGYEKRGIVTFDLSSIPSGAQVTSAILYLHEYSTQGTARTIGVHRVTSSWTEGGITWNSRDGTNNWGTAGGDFISTATEQKSISWTGVLKWDTWDVTSDVTAFVSGTYSNYGWIVKDENEGAGANYYWQFNSKEAASNQPKLQVTYTLIDASSWFSWYSGWQYRKKITIDDAKVQGSSDLSNFPVLINLASDSGLASHAQNDGDDILFTSSDGATKLDHEIEKFVYSTGELQAWVKIPTLSHDT